MRKTMGAVCLLGLALAVPVRAQSSSMFGGIDPSKLSFVPVDTSNVAVPIARPSQSGFTNFSLTKLFSGGGFSLTNTRPIGMSKFPTQDQLPGQGWLDAFHYSRPARRK